MRAIVFAAGKGSRLGDLTYNLPKSCLELNSSSSLLTRQMDILVQLGFQELVIVTGYAANVIEEITAPYNSKFTSLKLIYNSEFEVRNNIYTAYLIRELIDEETVIFNSDIVFDFDILKNLVRAIQLNPQASFMVVDDSKPSVDEDMKVLLNETGAITRINKQLVNEDAFGEFIGMMRLAGQERMAFIKSLEKMIAELEYDKYYEDALDRIASKINLQAFSTQGLEWTEVDTVEDLNKARSLNCVKSPYLSSLK